MKLNLVLDNLGLLLEIKLKLTVIEIEKKTISK